VSFAFGPFVLNINHFRQWLLQVSSVRMLFVMIAFFLLLESVAQDVHPHDDVADFELTPNPVCAKDSVFIHNLSTGAVSYRWSFSTGNPEENSRDESFGNLLYLLEEPGYITLVRSGSEFYSFISDAGNGMVVRNKHRANLLDHPREFDTIIKADPLNYRLRGIQVMKHDNGNWYGFVVRENMLVRLFFGASLDSIPVASDVATDGTLVWGDGLVFCREGNDWLGFCTDITTNNMSVLTSELLTSRSLIWR
jgi:hypothetical protein